MTPETPTDVRVSVIVAVFNPGAGFDDLIESLDRQSLGTDAFEVLLCDDGSDAATQHRLAEVAASRPHVRVLALPHTGWPGTPRNHGIDAARGRYVFFADHDDRFFDGGLKSLCDYADARASDVVIGRVVGIGRKIPRRIFRADIPHAVLGQDPLLELLTPHKLFRTAFLREHGIRFPDGRVRLEDHLFVMRAYFAATTISILASEPCYGWVKHSASASASRIDPETYFPHLQPVLDLVEEHTEPGELRDTLLRHWYRGKILNRLAARRMVRYPAPYRAAFLDVVTPLVRDRFGPGVDAGLSFPLRVRSALLRAGSREGLLHLAELEAALECRAEVAAAHWSRTGTLELTLRVRFLSEGRNALEFDPSAAWRPPEPLAHDLAGVTGLDAARELRRDRLEIVQRDDGDGDGDARRIAARGVADWHGVTVTVDPLKVFSRVSASRGGPLEARVRHAGWNLDVPLRADAGVLRAAGRSPLLAGRRAALVVGHDGVVALRRQWPKGRLRDFGARVIRRGGARVRRALGGRAARPRTDAATGQSNAVGAHSPGVVSGASRTSTPDLPTVPTHTSSE
jgi:glycosyltransferase involved in cell wall biosynthesis